MGRPFASFGAIAVNRCSICIELIWLMCCSRMGAPDTMPSKYVGKRWAMIMPWRPPPELPM